MNDEDSENRDSTTPVPESSDDDDSPDFQPPMKRPRMQDESIQQMQRQLNLLSRIVHANLSAPVSVAPASSVNNDPGSSNFLNMPKPPEVRTLSFGDLKTSVDEKRTVPSAPKDRVDAIISLQRFGSIDWKEVRYAPVLRSFLASPGFIDLKINEELCHLEKGKDPVAPTERALAGLSNAILENRNLLRSSLQGIVDWASANPDQLNAQSLFDQFNSSFGMNSLIMKNYEQMLQIVCGKRAECIEVRRERLIGEVTTKNLQVALRKLPPSAEYLFAKDNLSGLMQSLGGAQVWLNTPSYVVKRSSGQKYGQSSKGYSNRSQQIPNNPKRPFVQKEEHSQRPNNNKGNKTFPKNEQSKSKDDSFRKKPGK